MLEKIISNVVNKLILSEINQNEPKFVAFRMKLSKEAANYFMDSIFPEHVKSQVNKSLKDAFATRRASIKEQKLNDDNPTLEKDFIEFTSKKCLEIMKPYMEDYNRGLELFEDDNQLKLQIENVKTGNQKKYTNICVTKNPY